MGVRLPAEYQEVEYLESTGYQFILTGLTIAEVSSLRTNWSLRFSLTEIRSAQIIAGVSKDSKQLPFLQRDLRESDWCGNTGNIANIELNRMYEIKQEDGWLILNGQSAKIIKESTGETLFGLFGKNHNNNQPEPGTLAYMRFYGFSAESSGVDMADLVPCYRKSDHKPGLYDLATNEFLTNRLTWNDFIVGPDVIDSISPLMVAWRRMLMRDTRQKPIYSIRDYNLTDGVLDTGVLLAQEGSVGYSIIAKFDSSENTDGIVSIINGAGIYGSYSYIYLTNGGEVYGVKAGERVSQNYFPPSDQQKTWLESICISVDLQDMKTCIFMNDRPAPKGTITTFETPTATLKINGTDRRGANILLNSLDIYPFPLTEEQMRNLINS